MLLTKDLSLTSTLGKFDIRPNIRPYLGTLKNINSSKIKFSSNGDNNIVCLDCSIISFIYFFLWKRYTTKNRLSATLAKNSYNRKKLHLDSNHRLMKQFYKGSITQ